MKMQFVAAALLAFGESCGLLGRPPDRVGERCYSVRSYYGRRRVTGWRELQSWQSYRQQPDDGALARNYRGAIDGAGLRAGNPASRLIGAAVME